MERLREIVLEGGPHWRDNFSNYVESLDEAQLEVALSLFIEEAVRKQLYVFSIFTELYEITSAIWQRSNIYLPWVEVISKYGTEEMFQIMDEDVNTDESWFLLLVLDSAFEISTERLASVISWLDGGGHSIKGAIIDYVDKFNLRKAGTESDEKDIAVILTLATYLHLDVASETWAKDGNRLSLKITPYLATSHLMTFPASDRSRSVHD